MLRKTKSKMPFWDHILEFRNRLLFVLISVIIFTVFGYIFYSSFFTAISEVIQEEMYATRITEGFTTRLRVSLLIGVFLSIPFLFYQIMQFIFPALTKKSKLFILFLLIASFSLFAGGIVFGYKTVMPISMDFLKSREFFPENVSRLISYDRFIVFFFQFLIGFGICFQFPIILLSLMKLEVISVRSLIKFAKYFVLVFFVFAAIITPPDIISQLLLIFPMVLLYALCIIIGKIFRLGGG
jgi:sec-independent protein translocase protein TatC